MIINQPFHDKRILVHGDRILLITGTTKPCQISKDRCVQILGMSENMNFSAVMKTEWRQLSMAVMKTE